MFTPRFTWSIVALCLCTQATAAKLPRDLTGLQTLRDEVAAQQKAAEAKQKAAEAQRAAEALRQADNTVYLAMVSHVTHGLMAGLAERRSESVAERVVFVRDYLVGSTRFGDIIEGHNRYNLSLDVEQLTWKPKSDSTLQLMGNTHYHELTISGPHGRITQSYVELLTADVLASLSTPQESLPSGAQRLDVYTLNRARAVRGRDAKVDSFNTTRAPYTPRATAQDAIDDLVLIVNVIALLAVEEQISERTSYYSPVVSDFVANARAEARARLEAETPPVSTAPRTYAALGGFTAGVALAGLEWVAQNNGYHFTDSISLMMGLTLGSSTFFPTIFAIKHIDVASEARTAAIESAAECAKKEAEIAELASIRHNILMPMVTEFLRSRSAAEAGGLDAAEVDDLVPAEHRENGPYRTAGVTRSCAEDLSAEDIEEAAEAEEAEETRALDQTLTRR
jgi:hypothetical protein